MENSEKHGNFAYTKEADKYEKIWDDQMLQDG